MVFQQTSHDNWWGDFSQTLIYSESISITDLWQILGKTVQNPSAAEYPWFKNAFPGSSLGFKIFVSNYSVGYNVHVFNQPLTLFSGCRGESRSAGKEGWHPRAHAHRRRCNSSVWGVWRTGPENLQRGEFNGLDSEELRSHAHVYIWSKPFLRKSKATSKTLAAFTWTLTEFKKKSQISYVNLNELVKSNWNLIRIVKCGWKLF